MREGNILITGSEGLIGSALKKQLELLKFKVIGIDRAYAAEHAEYGDINNYELLKSLAANCKGIIHLAGVSRVITGEKNPSFCWQENVNGTRNILDVAKNSPNRPWVIYASSREVYGQQEHLPVQENAKLLPTNIYAFSKVAAEQLVSHCRELGLQTATIRFSNVYGSTKDYPDRVIPAFCRAAAYFGNINIEGEHNIFDFTHIDDVVSGVIKVIGKLQHGETALPTVHLTSGCGTTLLQAAELAKKFSKVEVKFINSPARSFDVSKFYGDPGLAKSLLGWQTNISLEEGIARLINDFNNEACRN